MELRMHTKTPEQTARFRRSQLTRNTLLETEGSGVGSRSFDLRASSAMRCE
jgi:hypothetical protein